MSLFQTARRKTTTENYTSYHNQSNSNRRGQTRHQINQQVDPTIYFIPQHKVDELKNLSRLCHSHNHALPVYMTYRYTKMAKKGFPMTIYACTFPGCGYHEAWSVNFTTGKPKKLWSNYGHC